MFGKPWVETTEEMRKNSPFGGFESFKLRQIIVKGGDDLRQEYVAYQILKKFQSIWELSGLPL